MVLHPDFFGVVGAAPDLPVTKNYVTFSKRQKYQTQLKPQLSLNIREHGSFGCWKKNPRTPNKPQGNAKRSWPCVCAAVPLHAPPFPLPPWPPSLRGASAPRRRCAAEPDCRGWARRRKVGKGNGPSWESAQGGAFYLWVWNFDKQIKNKSRTILDKTICKN